MNILITGIGGVTPRSIALTLRSGRESLRIIGTDSNPHALGFFMHGLLDEKRVLPQADASGYWPAVEELIAGQKIDLAFVQPETEVIEWARYYHENGHYPVKVLIPPLKLAEVLVDKRSMSGWLKDTPFIPATIKLGGEYPDFGLVDREIGYPCWIRASMGSGGRGAMKVENEHQLRSWLWINPALDEFLVSEFLPGRHLANQMLYFKGRFIKGAMLECVDYVMASSVPSRVTGNTSYGRFLNEDPVLNFCREAVDLICRKLGVVPHGVLSCDLKEDSQGKPKITEINVRHMAYTGIMAKLGFNLVEDTIELLTRGSLSRPEVPYFKFDEPYSFFRDVDIEPIILSETSLSNT